MTAGRIAGVVLAAGAGRRMGQPKALVAGRDGRPWVVGAVGVLRDAGCHDIFVAVGASSDLVRRELDPAVVVVDVPDWQQGMGVSLKTCLAALDETSAESAVIHLVDLPDVGADAVARLLARSSSGALARASYDGDPGHPVLLGREHWSAAAGTLSGDRGAAAYLNSNGVELVECGDLATGHDIDTPQALADGWPGS